ncbi:Major facilitator superfamily domain, general substrate transporter [Metarhizium album ARSEF 1941]|uniref:Major facilitator superfamily domain, general substrate transporter n=1 Tax=Metarhizium album (strain ARSEF 1941) TaxID=1081103 RepID=A0A0B2WH04_METAS|nr:Major facilitator superfamily domain, general substrate transporter [Metarhizium album ARSEF 1941]KHN95261.1 Major facilitator superfamily domain, general substrate transporter [Metarhizium album ARSEF 1941]
MQPQKETSDVDATDGGFDRQDSPGIGSAAPDGGVLAWLHVVLMHIVFFNTWGVANGYGVFQEYYTRTLGETQAAIAWVGSVQVFFLFGIGAVAGRVTDAGYFRITFTIGVFLQLLGLYMTSLCRTYWQILLAQGVCLGVGNGFTFCPALSILSQYFEKYRAFAVGLAAAGAAVGGLVYPVLIQWLIFRHDFGFPWTLRVMGFIMLATYLPCIFLFKPRLPPRKSGDWTDKSAFSDVPFIFFSLSMFLNFWGLYFAFFFLGTFARDKIGFTDPIHLLMVLNGVGVVGRGALPVVADKWVGMLNMVIPLSLAASLLVYCWAAVASVAGLYTFAVIYGLLAAALQALLPAVATTMTPDPSRTGTRVGMILSFVSLANLTGPAICGAIIQQEGGGYMGAQMFAASSIFLGSAMALAARIARAGSDLKRRV